LISAYVSFRDAIQHHLHQLRVNGKEVDTGHWQGISTKGKPDLTTLELLDVAFRTTVPYSLDDLAFQIEPNLPWADLEFEDRTSREPRNPHHSLEHWPWWHGQTGQTMYHGMFSHTYAERFWPKQANLINPHPSTRPITGIRYEYGDLDDVINLLVREPYTRQAYLPIFFPEDTGANHGGRIPCTLGYHFLLRDSKLHTWYEIRSCDAVRHFRDDLYLAARLAQWVIEECQLRELDKVTREKLEPWASVRPGDFTFHAHSFHVHKGDLHHLEPRRA